MPRLELAQLQLSPRHLALLRELLARHAPHAQVWAYGSRVTGSSHEGSDLDIVLRNPAWLNAEVSEWPEVLEALRDSDLPMLVDVHDWAHLPADFQRTIERGYVEIQAGTTQEEQEPEADEMG